MSVLDRYKSFMSCEPVVVTDGGVLSVFGCMDCNACSIVMPLYGFCVGSVFVCLCGFSCGLSCRLEALQ